MLRSIKQLYGEKLDAKDGELGRVKDFYFDDEHWEVRYMVVDLGIGLAGRQVLISLHAFGNFDQNGDCMRVELARSQIENSPPTESQKPVSRQYEEDFYRYYRWPDCWEGMELWEGAGYPVMPLPPEPLPGGASHAGSPKDDFHLRSTRNVASYHIHTGDGAIGHVTDFMIDDKSWAVRHLVVETGHWFYGKEIIISPSHIERISYEESTVFVNVKKEAIRDATEHHMPRARYHYARGSESTV